MFRISQITYEDALYALSMSLFIPNKKDLTNLKNGKSNFSKLTRTDTSVYIVRIGAELKHDFSKNYTSFDDMENDSLFIINDNTHSIVIYKTLRGEKIVVHQNDYPYDHGILVEMDCEKYHGEVFLKELFKIVLK